MLRNPVFSGLALLVVIGLAISAAGCQPTPTKTPVGTAAPTATTAPVSLPTEAKITLIIAQPKGEPFATMVYGGLEKLKAEMGDKLTIKLVESLDKAEHKEQVRAAAEMGINPVMTLWDDLANAVVGVAPEFPDTQFVIVDSYVTAELPNVRTVVIEPQEASFIAGVVAAKKTETKKVGFVGGADIPVIEKFYAGFAAGVKYADPSIEIVEVYAGTFIDPAKGLEVGTNLFNQGCDIVMHAANKTGLGVIKAAEQAGKQAIGVDMWQGDVAPGHVLWSALKDAGTATHVAAKEGLTDPMETGLWIYDRKAGATLYDERDFEALDKDTQQVVLDVEGLIENGTLKAPDTKAELEQFSESMP